MKLSLSAIRPLLSAESIDCAGVIPLADCRITRPYLLERANLPTDAGSVLMLALPYRTSAETGANISAYAIPLDYHYIAAALFARLIPRLEASFPGARFAGFADHSPIDERHAAAIAGLGRLGDNGLIITELYGSYVFLAELITDLPTDAAPCAVQNCCHCGACRSACPVDFDPPRCLSALTQKKGTLTSEEEDIIRACGSAWGCDRCQTVCPLNRTAQPSPLPDFAADRLPHLSTAVIEAMDNATFARRAYAWRGRGVILRNLRLLEKPEPNK